MPRHHASAEVNGERLRELRKEQGMTVKQCAALIGISQGYLAHIERGDRPTVAPATFNRICATLNVPRVHLLRNVPSGAE
jgi:transcriptional regulator with XRE-family HTH domain